MKGGTQRRSFGLMGLLALAMQGFNVNMKTGAASNPKGGATQRNGMNQRQKRKLCRQSPHSKNRYQ